MKPLTKKIVLLYLLFVIVKITLSYFIPSISAFSDEYYYAKLARSFFFEQGFSIHGIKVMFYQPLYPIIISLSYIFKDMELVYFAMKAINAIVSTLVIIPSYLLAKEFLDDKKSILAAMLISLAPPMFSFSPYIMAENLFYPLFMFSFYFIYKAFSTNATKHFLLSGIFVGLSFLTKTSGIVLVFLPGIFFALSLAFTKALKKGIISRLALLYLASAIVVSPWLVRNLLSFGSIFSYNAISDITAYSRHESYVLPLLNWILLYVAYIILATAMIFGISALIGLIKNFKLNTSEGHFHLLALISISTSILIAANHATGSVIYNTPLSFFTERPIGRYIDFILPLVFIAAFINFQRYYEKINPYIVASSILLLFGSQLAIAPLLPPNNISLTLIGILKYAIDFFLFNKTSLDFIFYWQTIAIIAVALFAVCLLFMVLKKLGLNKLVFVAMLFFVLTSISAYSITYYNAKTYWFNGDQMQVGYFLNTIDKERYSTVLIDSRDCTGKISRVDQSTLCENTISSISGFFINDEIIVKNPEEFKGFDYAITRHQLGLELIKDINGIHIYKNV